MVRRKLLGDKSVAAEYQPDFTECVDHFVIHAGGFWVGWGWVTPVGGAVPDGSHRGRKMGPGD